MRQAFPKARGHLLAWAGAPATHLNWEQGLQTHLTCSMPHARGCLWLGGPTSQEPAEPPGFQELGGLPTAPEATLFLCRHLEMGFGGLASRGRWMCPPDVHGLTLETVAGSRRQAILNIAFSWLNALRVGRDGCPAWDLNAVIGLPTALRSGASSVVVSAGQACPLPQPVTC